MRWGCDVFRSATDLGSARSVAPTVTAQTTLNLPSQRSVAHERSNFSAQINASHPEHRCDIRLAKMSLFDE
jgi:hypothetical protein